MNCAICSNPISDWIERDETGVAHWLCAEEAMILLEIERSRNGSYQNKGAE